MSYFAITFSPKSIKLNSKKINLLYQALLCRLIVSVYIKHLQNRFCGTDQTGLFLFLSESERESERATAFLLITVLVVPFDVFRW